MMGTGRHDDPFLGEIYGLTSSEFSSSAALRNTWEEAVIKPSNPRKLYPKTYNVWKEIPTWVTFYK